MSKGKQTFIVANTVKGKIFLNIKRLIIREKQGVFTRSFIHEGEELIIIKNK